MNVTFYLSHDIKIAKSSHFCMKCQELASCWQRYNGRHYVTKSVFYCMALYHSRRDVILMNIIFNSLLPLK